MANKRQSERDEFIAKLRETLKPGDTLHTVLRSVSRSGMSRELDVYKLTCENGEVVKQWLTYWVAKACDFTFNKATDNLKVSGCGMDMGFSVVYDLGRTLWPEGFGVMGKLPMGHEIRPTSKENALKAVEHGATFRGRNGDPTGWDEDGGYALKQVWL